MLFRIRAVGRGSLKDKAMQKVLGQCPSEGTQ
jgi:hypothetical protein